MWQLYSMSFHTYGIRANTNSRAPDSTSPSQLRDIRFLSIQMTSPCSHTFASGEPPSPSPSPTTTIPVSTAETTIRYDIVFMAQAFILIAKSTRRMNSSPTRDAPITIEKHGKWIFLCSFYRFRRDRFHREIRDDSSLIIFMFFMLNKNMLSLFPTW